MMIMMIGDYRDWWLWRTNVNDDRWWPFVTMMDNDDHLIITSTYVISPFAELRNGVGKNCAPENIVSWFRNIDTAFAFLYANTSYMLINYTAAEISCYSEGELCKTLFLWRSYWAMAAKIQKCMGLLASKWHLSWSIMEPNCWEFIANSNL